MIILTIICNFAEELANMIKTTTYPPSIEAKIGFSAVREMVAACCVSPLGRRRVEEMTFSPDFDTVDSRIGAVAEMMAIITSGEAFPQIGRASCRERV